MDETLTADKLNNFLMVADKAKKDPLPIQTYFLSSWDTDSSTQIASQERALKTI
jgi:hypothetical protein